MKNKHIVVIIIGLLALLPACRRKVDTVPALAPKAHIKQNKPAQTVAVPVPAVVWGQFTPLQAQWRTVPGTFFDTQPVGKKVSYIYAPGLMGSEIMMGRYCPQFTAVTGEKITWKSGGHVIGQPHSAVIFPEINLKKPVGFTLNPVTSFIDGVRRDLFPLIQRYFQEKFNFTIEDNPQSDNTVAGYTFNFGESNIGQKKDIKALHKTYHDHIKQYPNTNIVLYGDSRGAATIFNFIVQHKPHNVKAAVLEGIFDDIPHVIKHFMYNDKGGSVEERLYGLLTFTMGSYNKKGPFPRQLAETITDDIPLLFITSLKDSLVAPQCTLYLYKRLKERGFKKIHLIVLKEAIHPCYMISDAADRTLYETAVHAFYKQYHLPHNSVKAAEGKAAFAASQPTVADIKRLYKLPECPSC
jgi:hypothetical protein